MVLGSKELSRYIWVSLKRLLSIICGPLFQQTGSHSGSGFHNVLHHHPTQLGTIHQLTINTFLAEYTCLELLLLLISVTRKIFSKVIFLYSRKYF